ncbi:MAG TPA: OmpA family protein [Alphaproteobacteria bacterium]|nr:OmpA family protein [Alphaproteobacteria bacterium]HNS45096.1 OmpA family protein [Alphaproteobacteria bacterium]
MILTRTISAFLFSLSLPVSGWAAENIGEYGKADVEVNRSVLQELDNYQPPPMFAAPPSERVAIPPPAQQQLTAPNSETLLQHPVENHHVFTVQKSPGLTPLPVPEDEQVSQLPPPLPPKKPAHIPDTTVKSVVADEDEGMERLTVIDATPPLPKPDAPAAAAPASEPVKKTVAAKPAYKPSAPKSMPAVPPVKVESKPIPSMANLPPAIDPEKAEKPNASERMMDDALTRHMVKDDERVREVLGAPASPKAEEMNQFSMAFKAGDTDLLDDQKNLLNQDVITRLSSDTSIRLQIRAYASRTDGSESSSRRISLSRALATRSYLLEKGIQPTRIDVRALSDKTTEPPLDRIDMSFIESK